MDIDNLTYGELKQIAGMFSNPSDITNPNGSMRIVVLDRGWVVVGNLYLDKGEYRLDKGRVIRKWGTTDGLMQLANDGPTSNTKLESLGQIRFHIHSVVLQFDIQDKSKWV